MLSQYLSQTWFCSWQVLTSICWVLFRSIYDADSFTNLSSKGSHTCHDIHQDYSPHERGEARLHREDRQIPEGVEKWHGFELDENPCQEGNFNVLQIAIQLFLLRSDFHKKNTIFLHC